MAATNLETVTIKGDGITLDLLVWRRYRRRIPGFVERILGMEANHGIAALGPILPVGTIVTMPIISSEALPARRKTIKLWD